ncbi:hypothetical protein DK846_10685 [Methanospirillum lacunae]|uniref:Uncharacterized protein n=1 Tax=Methanospirillum lacunae TaxID=668570 RepID=A0A2V2MT01_9EURY|nr:hypothetical protein DK846_10685 [Methanospirillum lacunae]
MLNCKFSLRYGISLASFTTIISGFYFWISSIFPSYRTLTPLNPPLIFDPSKASSPPAGTTHPLELNTARDVAYMYSTFCFLLSGTDPIRSYIDNHDIIISNAKYSSR